MAVRERREREDGRAGEGAHRPRRVGGMAQEPEQRQKVACLHASNRIMYRYMILIITKGHEVLGQNPAAPHNRPKKRRSARVQALRRALHRTRTDDPFLTMEVLYQLS